MKCRILFWAKAVPVLLAAMATSGALAQSGIKINEVMANNKSVSQNGIVSDWVELYNPTTSAVDLNGASLRDSSGNQFIFPVGVSIPAQSYLVIRFDSAAAPSPTNTGFGLKANGDTVSLYSRVSEGSVRIDEIAFGIQPEDFAIGRIPDGSDSWALCLPTFGTANSQTALGSVFSLSINEWMADPQDGEDWFELYNADNLPVALGGLFFADSERSSRIPDLSFIGSGLNGYIRFEADRNLNAGADHVDFRLGRTADIIALFNTDFAEIDRIDWGPPPAVRPPQVTGISEGRLPDGSENLVAFENSPTPGKPNKLLLSITNVVINELLAHTDPPLEDAVELRNLTSVAVNISGWYLSDDKADLKKYRIPNGTTIAANGYKVFYEYQFYAPNLAKRFNFNSAHGGNIYLARFDSSGNPIAFSGQSFGASANGVSFGRFVKSDGEDFVAMSRLSFGTSVTRDSPIDQLSVFRTGRGAPNPSPLIGPVIINEIMYHPPDIGTNDNSLDEYIELRNITASPVPLYDPLHPENRWHVGKGSDTIFVFPKYTVPANGYFLLVNFNPTNLPQATAFRARYGVSTTVKLFGPYGGQLDNSGENLELYKPDPPQLPPHPDAGFVPYILVDKVKYRDSLPWPPRADGTGNSLQRKGNRLYGDDPANWRADAPTPGGANGVSPVISITSPPNNARVSTATITVQGQTVDAGGVATNYVQVNNGDLNPATGANDWSIEVTLVPGTNVITATAVDVGYNASLPALVTVFYAVPSPLTLTVSDGGTVTGVENGQLLDIGGGYSAVAQPAAGYLFERWSGDVNSTSAALRFVMVPNMVLNAHFVVNPFIPVKGLYNGLFYVSGGVAPTNAGFFRLTLADPGSFSGRIILGRTTNNFTGQFGLDRHAVVQVPRAGTTPLYLQLDVTSHGEVLGTVQDGNGSWIANLTSYLTGPFAEPAGYAGRYTWVIPGADNPTNSPGGDGAGAAVINTNGTVVFTGTLGDGTSISNSAGLSKSGEFPLSSHIYGGKGLLFGWVLFYTNDVMFTNLTWIKPPIAGNPYYAAGFSGLKDFHGSKYTRPPAGQNILGWTNGLVVLGGGNIAPNITNRVRVINNVVTVLDGNSRRINIALSVANGTFKGTFKHPVTRTTNSFSGALLQLQHWGGGWFKGKNQTGFISLEPVPPAVSIVSPTNNTVVDACANVAITAEASLVSGWTARVEFFANGASIGSDDTAPYESTFAPTANGIYTFVAVATDNLGSQTISVPVMIEVINCP